MPKNAHLVRAGIYVSKTARKKEIALEKGFIVQHVDGPGLSGPGDHGSDRSGEGRTVIRELLDEALGARRRKALGIRDSEEPPGKETAETLHTIQTLLLRLIKRTEMSFRGQNIGLKLLRENLIEARAGREVVFEELVEKQWMAKGKTKETMTNFFDMKTRYVKEYVDGVVKRIKEDEAREYDEVKRP